MYTVFIISVYNVMHTVSYRRLSKNITTEDTINYLNTQTDESKLIIHGNLFVSIYRQIIITKFTVSIDKRNQYQGTKKSTLDEWTMDPLGH